jgi:hypothetical protein
MVRIMRAAMRSNILENENRIQHYESKSQYEVVMIDKNDDNS